MKILIISILLLSQLSVYSSEPEPAQIAYCAQWEEQCKEDPFDPGKIECTQHCIKYEDEAGAYPKKTINNANNNIFIFYTFLATTIMFSRNK